MPRKFLHYDAMKRLAGHALANGARRESATRITWDLAGGCEEPKHVLVEGRPEPPDGSRWSTILAGKSHPLFLELETRCRRCDPCRRARQVLWTLRAKAEVQSAIRTWFGTLTLRPEEQHRALMLARKRLATQGLDYDLLPFGEQFILRHQEINIELTKWLKRVRKESGAPFKYILVAEHHKSGWPHYHVLVHEQSMFDPVKERCLHGQWRLGFSRWKLITELRQATYICKYLSKSSVARVRASLNYGSPDPMHALKSIASEMTAKRG